MVLEAHLACGEMKYGRICIGGLLTIIAHAFGFVPVEGIHHLVAGSHLVDIDTLINMHMCRYIGGGQYRLLDVAGHVIQQDEEEDAEEEPKDEEQAPKEEHVDMQGFEGHAPPLPRQHDLDIMQIMERFDRLETACHAAKTSRCK